MLFLHNDIAWLLILTSLLQLIGAYVLTAGAHLVDNAKRPPVAHDLDIGGFGCTFLTGTLILVFLTGNPCKYFITEFYDRINFICIVKHLGVVKGKFEH